MTEQSAPPAAWVRTWQVIAPDDCVWASYGDEHVVYHRPSGQTHFLNEASARLVQHILLQPRTVEQAARELAAGTAREPDEHWLAVVTEAVIRLDQLGLLRQGRERDCG